MQVQPKTTLITPRIVAMEMAALAAYALLLGLAVSILVALPVVLLSATVS